jgi:hypothetical protein
MENRAQSATPDLPASPQQAVDEAIEAMREAARLVGTFRSQIRELEARYRLAHAHALDNTLLHAFKAARQC